MRQREVSTAQTIRPRTGAKRAGRAELSRGWTLALQAVAAVLLVAAVFLVYRPVWHGAPIWDDDGHMTKPELRSGDGLRRIWFELGATQQYYPLLHSFFWLQWQLWGDATLGYHLVNIALHAAAAILVALVLRRLGIPGAYLAAAVFALHPVQVESVAWITEQKNTLSAVFYLSAALAYLRFDQSREKLSYALALVLFVLGLLSKTVTATLPAALLVVFWWQRGRLSWRRDVLPLLPFFFLGAAAGALTAWVERTLIGATGAMFEFTLPQRLLMAGRVPWFYLSKLLWPAQLIFLYPRWQLSAAVWWQYLYPAAGLLVLAAAVFVALRRQWRGPLCAVLFFVGTLFPVLGFFNVYPFRYSLVADHFQYLACLGIITLLSAGVALLLGRLARWPRLAGQAACLVVLLTLATLSWRQTWMYADVEKLYRTTIDRNPDCLLAQHNLGNILALSGRSSEAIDHFRQTLRLDPTDAECHNNLANILATAGKTDEAIEHLRDAIRLQPNYSLAHNNLANVLAASGKTEEAIAHFRRALQIEPDLAQAHYNLGRILADTGKTDEAIEHYRQALRLKPDFAMAQNNLGKILAAAGKPDEAIEHYTEALRLQPDLAAAHNNLGTVLVGLGKVEEAIAHHQEAVRLEPKSFVSHYNLGISLAAAGRMHEAIAQFTEAVRLKPDVAAAHHNLAVALSKVGKMQEAVEHYAQAARLKPDFTAAHYNLAVALMGLGRTEEALEHFNRLLQLMPDSSEVLMGAAWLLATSEPAAGGDPARAVQLAERARGLAGDTNAAMLDTLAAAYAAAGRFADAVATAEKAAELAESSGQAALAGLIRARLELYRANKPYRVAPGSPGQGQP